jgi:ComF family protein
MQAALRLVYPPRCLACGEGVDSDFGLCGPCWRDTPFVVGAVCDHCGAPQPGEMAEGIVCDDCLRLARPWERGRAAMVYDGAGRQMVLALKHADRTDLARPAAGWLARAAAPLVVPGMLVVPVPLHWWRLVRRRYNQSALLAAGLARRLALDHCPDALIRRRRTPSQEGRSREARFANLAEAIAVHPRRAGRLCGRPVLLVDDVMTSGATLAACAEACLAAGSGPVSVVTLARAVRD